MKHGIFFGSLSCLIGQPVIQALPLQQSLCMKETAMTSSSSVSGSSVIDCHLTVVFMALCGSYWIVGKSWCRHRWVNCWIVCQDTLLHILQDTLFDILENTVIAILVRNILLQKAFLDTDVWQHGSRYYAYFPWLNSTLVTLRGVKSPPMYGKVKIYAAFCCCSFLYCTVPSFSLLASLSFLVHSTSLWIDALLIACFSFKLYIYR